jgi:hypothetical protein
MKVKLLSIMSGPDGSHDIGSVLDLPKPKAKELIDGGFAVAVDEKAEAEAAAEDPAEPRTPNEEQAGEFGKRAVSPETTAAKHPHAEPKHHK